MICSELAAQALHEKKRLCGSFLAQYVISLGTPRAASRKFTAFMTTEDLLGKAEVSSGSSVPRARHSQPCGASLHPHRITFSSVYVLDLAGQTVPDQSFLSHASTAFAWLEVELEAAPTSSPFEQQWLFSMCRFTPVVFDGHASGWGDSAHTLVGHLDLPTSPPHPTSNWLSASLRHAAVTPHVPFGDVFVWLLPSSRSDH